MEAAAICPNRDQRLAGLTSEYVVRYEHLNMGIMQMQMHTQQHETAYTCVQVGRRPTAVKLCRASESLSPSCRRRSPAIRRHRRAFMLLATGAVWRWSIVPQ